MPCRVLIANPNTSSYVTELLLAVARRWASPSMQLQGATAAFGAAAI